MLCTSGFMNDVTFGRSGPYNRSPILIMFGKKMPKRLELCEVYSFSTKLNSRHHTTVLNADVPNCYTTLKFVICNKLSNDLISTQ